jgi:hypothetical protein
MFLPPKHDDLSYNPMVTLAKGFPIVDGPQLIEQLLVAD